MDSAEKSGVIAGPGRCLVEKSYGESSQGRAQCHG